jgi:hypothetical protein
MSSQKICRWKPSPSLCLQPSAQPPQSLSWALAFGLVNWPCNQRTHKPDPVNTKHWIEPTANTQTDNKQTPNNKYKQITSTNTNESGKTNFDDDAGYCRLKPAPLQAAPHRWKTINELANN